MDTTSVAIIAVVVVAAFLFGGNKVRQWARTAGQAKGEFNAGVADSEVQTWQDRQRVAEAKSAALAAESKIGPPATSPPHAP